MTSSPLTFVKFAKSITFSVVPAPSYLHDNLWISNKMSYVSQVTQINEFTAYKKTNPFNYKDGCRWRWVHEKAIYQFTQKIAQWRSYSRRAGWKCLWLAPHVRIMTAIKLLLITGVTSFALYHEIGYINNPLPSATKRCLLFTHLKRLVFSKIIYFQVQIPVSEVLSRCY